MRSCSASKNWSKLWNLNSFPCVDLGYLPFTWENRTWGLEVEWSGPFRLTGLFRRRGLWFEARQFFFSFYSVQIYCLDIICGGLFFHHETFYSFLSMHKISTRLVCVSGEQPSWLTHRSQAHVHRHKNKPFLNEVSLDQVIILSKQTCMWDW